MVLRLTERGEAMYNGVIALFYAGAVKTHLLELADTGKTKKLELNPSQA